MNAPTLRPLLAGDADAVAALHATSWRSAYRGILPDDFLDHGLDDERRTVWRERLQSARLASAFGVVADHDGHMAGFAYAVRHDDPVWGTLVDNLHVHPHAKGGGIGGRLLQAVARQLGPDHVQPLYLWVLDANEPAKRFYARLGAEFADQVTEALPFSGLALPKWRCVWRNPASLLADA